MKKLLLLLCVCLCVQIGYAQTNRDWESYPVANTCISTSYPQTKYERQKYFSLAYFVNDTIFINFADAICCYDDVVLVATIDDNQIKFSSYELENDDYRGSGTITDDYLSIDYTISYGYSQEISETCHMESIPYICPSFTFGSGKIMWTFVTKDKDNHIVSTSQYRYKTIYEDNILENPLSFVTYNQNTQIYLLLEGSYDNGKTWNDVVYIREEANKVFTLDLETKQEKLLYDFNLKPNETFKGQTLRSIDTVDVGIYRKPRFEFTNDVWIKDIGSIQCPHFDKIPTGCTQELVCVQFNPVIYTYEIFSHPLWKNPNYETCSCEQTTIESIESQHITIFPDPVKDKLTLTLSNAENEIKIFDLQGKLLLQQNVGFSAEVNVSMLPTGTYMLVVNGESYKFIKK